MSVRTATSDVLTLYVGLWVGVSDLGEYIEILEGVSASQD